MATLRYVDVELQMHLHNVTLPDPGQAGVRQGGLERLTEIERVRERERGGGGGGGGGGGSREGLMLRAPYFAHRRGNLPRLEP